ncbi:MAG TPA: MFS transporter [Candidatus Omnitrophota bacterium]|nr:MFS transporter [Candidatus Omnitrophota bacterium]HNQ50664.1 MFS transporter [Candidatus Omnitrophota bacterium]
MEPTPVLPREARGLAAVFRALRHRNFRLFFIGQNISLIGTWMQNIAVGWMVYRMTSSAAMLGIVGFASQLPSLVLAPFAGVFADRWDKYRMIVICQVLAMIQALVIAVLTLSGYIAVWQIAALSLTLGIISAFEIPTRHAFLVQMVDRKEDLGNAIALNSLLFNLARLIGPPLAGFLITVWSEGICFMVNAASYGAVLWALARMRLPRHVRPANPSNHIRELKEGISYTFGSAPRRSILLFIGLMSLIAMSQSVLMPVFARDILGGGAHTLGFLAGAVGMGALAGAAYLAAWKDPLRMLSIMPAAAAVFGISLLLFSVSRHLWVSVTLLFFAGSGLMAHMVVSNTVLQMITEDAKRGRVMSFYTMAFMGMATFGTLLGGTVAGRIGAPLTVLGGGILCMAAAVLFYNSMPALKKSVSSHATIA